MGRMKLFVIEQWVANEWRPTGLYQGKFRLALARAQSTGGRWARVRRVKTPAERDQYLHLTAIGNVGRTEWVN